MGTLWDVVPVGEGDQGLARRFLETDMMEIADALGECNAVF